MAARILYVIVNLETGGSERQLIELVKGLNREKFSPHVCCLRGAGVLAGELEEMKVPLKVFRSPRLSYFKRIPNAWNFMLSVFRLRRLINNLKPDIVHAVLPMAFVAAGLASRFAGGAVLITARRCLGYYKEKRFILARLENLVNRWTDAVIANSRAVMEDTLRRERIDAEKLRVIYNGVRIHERIEELSREKVIGRKLAGPVVIHVANFIPYKGHGDLVRAAVKVVSESPSCTFILVGEGKLRGDIGGMIRRYGVEGNFILTGLRRDVDVLLSLADVAVLPSYEEGFPNAALEAMAAGKPVVATDVGGAREAVEEGETGILVQPRAPEQLARAIIKLVSDQDRAREMGMRGLERVRKYFSIERMVGEYERLYEELLKNSRQNSVDEIQNNVFKIGGYNCLVRDLRNNLSG